MATSNITGEKRAVKIVRKSGMTPKVLRWFKNEIAILKKITHPSTVKLYEVFEDEHRYYLIQE